MMKGEIGIERASNQMVIIDAYIIDELAEQNRELHDDRASAHLPCPGYDYDRYGYDMDINEVVAEVEDVETVIIIEF